MASTSTSTRPASAPSVSAPSASAPSVAKPSDAKPPIAPLERIGLTAGEIWRLLDTEGSQPISKLIKRIDAERDIVLQALGWLAREDKVSIEDDGRSRVISLK